MNEKELLDSWMDIFEPYYDLFFTDTHGMDDVDFISATQQALAPDVAKSSAFSGGLKSFMSWVKSFYAFPPRR